MSSTEELLKKLDAERDAYIATFLQVHEALAKRIIASNGPTSAPTSPLRSSALDRVARLSVSEGDRKGVMSLGSTFKTSISGEGDLSDDDEDLYVQDTLPPTSFDEETLTQHLRCYQWTPHAKKIMGYLMTKEGRLRYRDIFAAGQDPDADRYRYSLFEVFDVGTDGAPLHLLPDSSVEELDKNKIMWNSIKVC